MVLEWKTCVRFAVTILILFLVTKYWDVAMKFLGLAISAAFPLLLGCIIAYVANILMSMFERHFFPRCKKRFVKKIRRPICILFTFISIGLVVFLIINMILPELISCIEILAKGVVGAFSSFVIWAEQNVPLEMLQQSGLLEWNNINWQEMIQRVADILTTGVGGAMSSIVGIFSSVFGTVVTIIVAIIFSIYVLSGKEKLAESCTKFIKVYPGEKVYNKMMYVLGNLDESFHSFIVGQCIEAVILGVL